MNATTRAQRPAPGFDRELGAQAPALHPRRAVVMLSLVAALVLHLTIASPAQSAALVPGGPIAVSARVEPDLLRRLAEAGSPDEMFPVDIVLNAQASACDLDASIPDLPKPERRARAGRVLMDFTEASQQDLLAELKVSEAEGKVDGISPLWIVNAVGCRATRDVISQVSARSDVELICYGRVPCDLGSTTGEVKPAAVDSIEPNQQTINVRGAWNQGYHGEGVVLGVIDTGIWWTHPDLRGHLWTSDAYPHHGFNFGSYQHNPPGPSPYDTLTPLDYMIGHGTHVAGVATADGSYGRGVHETLGVAPDSRVMILAADALVDSDLEVSMIEGIQFCIRPPRDTLNGADVIVMFAGGLHDSLWRTIEENVLAAGLVNTLSAGNEGPTPGTICCPADCPPPWPNPANGVGGQSAVITVGATDNNDNLASFSSLGPTEIWDGIPPWHDYVYPPGLTDPDVVMPGVNILSTYLGPQHDTMIADTSYTTMSGTSISTPAVAGVVCLMLSKNPDLTPREIDSIIELYAVRDLGPAGKDNSFGAGRINCSLAVAYTPLPFVAIEEHPMPGTRPVSPLSTIVRGALRLPEAVGGWRSAVGVLMDISGRKVLDLHPGPNDASRLAPGVYFIQGRGAGGEGRATKIVIQR